MNKPAHPPVFAEQRKQQILELLERQGAVAVAELSALLQISEASVRRDLQQLEATGLLRRTHGGAIRNHITTFEPSLAEKEVENIAEKKAIARLALGLIEEYETVMLDAGSTTLQMARQWVERRGVTVVTNALNVAYELAHSNNEVVVIGGALRGKTLSMVGLIGETALSGLHIDKLFLAANGVDIQKGATTPHLTEAQTKQAMVARAREVILLADHSKFGRVTFSTICGIERLSCLITDAGTPAEYLRAAEKMGVRVLVAEAANSREA